MTNLAGLVALRFFLGIVEAGFFPGVILLLSCWYKVRAAARAYHGFLHSVSV